MGVSWSGLTGSPYRFQVGVEAWADGPADDGLTSIGGHANFWFNTPNTISYNNVSYHWRAWSSDGQFASGSGTFNANVSNGTLQMGSANFGIPVSWRGPLDWHVSVDVPAFLSSWSNGHPYAYWDDRLRYSAPYVSTNVAASYQSDSAVNVSWSQNWSQYGGARVENYWIDRWDSQTAAWKNVATLGPVTSFTDTTVKANCRYQYSVRPFNYDAMAGDAPWTGHVSTTPSAPTGLSATKATNGVDINLSWTNTAQTEDWQTEVWDKPNGGTAVLVTTVGKVASWTHVSPSSSASHQYYLRHKTVDSPTLYSANSVSSNTVTLLATPLAPSNIAPVVMDPADHTPVTWVHNPTDTTAQTAYELQHRLAGTSTWTTTGKVISTASSWTSSWSYTSGQSAEVQVRTWGQYATASPWSSTAVIVMSARPTALITTPTATVGGSTTSVGWNYFDAEGTAQSAAQVVLKKGTTVLETISIDGAGTTANLVTYLTNGDSYTVEVTVRDGSGLWSNIASKAFTVTYYPPAKPLVTAAWDQLTGAANLTISYVAPVGNEVATQTVEVWRGDVLVSSELAPSPGAPVAIIDRIPPLGGVTYTVVAWSSSPSSASVDVVLAPDDLVSGMAFINAGPGWGEVASLVANLSFSVVAGRARTTEHYSGRAYPVETIGTAIDKKVSISGVCLPGDDHTAYERVQLAGTTVCMRWAEGKEFVSLDSPSVSTNSQGAGHSVKLDGTVTDFKE